MKVKVEDTCTACGLCVDTCPEVFELGDEFAEVLVDEVPAEYRHLISLVPQSLPRAHEPSAGVRVIRSFNAATPRAAGMVRGEPSADLPRHRNGGTIAPGP